MSRPELPQNEEAALKLTDADALGVSEEGDTESLEKAAFGETATLTALKTAPMRGPLDTVSTSVAG